MSSIDISNNLAQLTYWKLTGYNDEQLKNFCAECDQDFMVAMITFEPNHDLKFAISNRTWKIQQGHYPGVLKFMEKVASTEIGKTLKGSVVVWLEDGAFEYTRLKTRTVPILSFGRSVDDYYSLLIPDPAFFEKDGYSSEISSLNELDTTPFESKIKTLFWRGAATGTAIHMEDWKYCARGKLVLKSQEISDPKILDAKFTKIDHIPKAQQDFFISQNLVDSYLNFSEFSKFAYLIDADGYHCAWRSLFLKLSSNSLTVKISSNLEQWYYNELVPWKHFVPLRDNLSDVIEISQWLNSHQSECNDIITSAQQLTRSITLDREIQRTAFLCKELLSYQKN